MNLSLYSLQLLILYNKHVEIVSLTYREPALTLSAKNEIPKNWSGFLNLLFEGWMKDLELLLMSTLNSKDDWMTAKINKIWTILVLIIV